MKKIIAAGLLATLLAAQGVAAATSVDRVSSPVREKEGAIAGAGLAMLLGALAVGGVVVAASSSGSDGSEGAPTSP